jgi:hypothetical protein
MAMTEFYFAAGTVFATLIIRVRERPGDLE